MASLIASLRRLASAVLTTRGTGHVATFRTIRSARSTYRTRGGPVMTRHPRSRRCNDACVLSANAHGAFADTHAKAEHAVNALLILSGIGLIL